MGCASPGECEAARVMRCGELGARLNGLRSIRGRRYAGIGCTIRAVWPKLRAKCGHDVGKMWAQHGQHIASWRAVPVIGMILIVLSELSDVVRFGDSTNRRAIVHQRVSLGIPRLSVV